MAEQTIRCPYCQRFHVSITANAPTSIVVAWRCPKCKTHVTVTT